jgi:hypothetical protein
MALPALLINVVALSVACPGAALLFLTRLREQRAMAELAAQSEERGHCALFAQTGQKQQRRTWAGD